MYHDFFAKSPLLALPIIALILFVTVFAMVVVRTFSKKQREVADEASRLPLEDDMDRALVVARVSKAHSEGRHE
jgi:cbb3-type cytochrome oxidase subunit 3